MLTADAILQPRDAPACGLAQVEELEETLNESVRDSVTGRSQAAREARAAKAERAKRRRQQLEDEEEAGAPLQTDASLYADHRSSHLQQMNPRLHRSA